MNKTELIKEVADRTDSTVKDTEELVDVIFDVIANHLVNNEKVVLSNFGTFEVRTRIARSGINPNNGETLDIPEQRTAAFKCGKQLKDRLR